MTNCRLQVKNFMTQDGTNGTRKMKRYTRASETSDSESTATTRIKRPQVEVNRALLEEIREINQQLIDTVADISDEDVDPSTGAAAVEGGEGIIVKCSFIPEHYRQVYCPYAAFLVSIVLLIFCSHQFSHKGCLFPQIIQIAPPFCWTNFLLKSVRRTKIFL